MKRITPRSEHKGYLELPITDFGHLHTYPFDIFVEDASKNLRLFASAESPVDQGYFAELKKKTSWVFISEKTIQETREKVRNTQSIYMDMDAFPVAWKTAETLFNAKMLLRELQQGGLNDGVVEHAHLMLSDLFQLVSHLGQAPNLRRLVALAKESDRSIACTTLSILMCKILKFEQNSIVEILGLASFFQDISLFSSPFGNLSNTPVLEMKPEAAKYFVQHPLLSADIVAKNTSVPEVTLQVIRQHHERKDRSGYPNRVGGLQLHPMAEILSLINSYLDHPEHFNEVKAEIYTHYSDRMVQAFQGLLDLLESTKKSAS
jgi:response regulator RpfG family c-di-GMP phosphodiesterase